MPNNYGQQDVKCPFYKSDDTRGISCEGLTEESILHLIFKMKLPKRKYKSRYCDSHYMSCEIYQMLMKKYDAQ